MNIHVNPPMINGRRLFQVRSWLDHTYLLLLTEYVGMTPDTAIFRAVTLYYDVLSRHSVCDLVANFRDGTLKPSANSHFTSEVMAVPEAEEFEVLMQLAHLECVQ